jgi:hypothetical protein
MARLSGPKEQFDDESAFKWGSYSRFLTLQRGRSLVSEKHRLDQRCPNPSIEGMPKRLRLSVTPHVKR